MLNDRPLPFRAQWIAIAVLVGAFLRLYGLGHQLLVDDELHAVHAALEMPWREILVSYQVTDFCQPLTAFYRFLLDRGVVLSEIGFRIPLLFASIATLFVLPGLAARWIGGRATVVFAWLLAISPMLVLYGRMVRSYALIVLLGCSAVFAFFSWWRRPRLVTGLLYAGLACTATYSHLGAATFVLSPFVFAGLEMVVRPEQRDRWRALALLAGSTGAGLLAFLLPAWPTLGPLIAEKRIEQSFRWSIVAPVLSLQAGSAAVGIVLAFWCLAALGLVTMFQRRRRWALYTLTAVATHLVGLIVLSPWGLRSPQIFNRYGLVLSPIFLLWVAVGLDRLSDGSLPPRSWSRPLRLAPALAVGLLFAFGPLVEPRFRISSFVHSHDLLSFFTEPARLPESEIPRFYRDLATRQPAGSIVEFPHRTNSLVDRTAYIYQEIHQRRVLASTLDPRLRDPRLALRGHVAPRPRDFLASGARYLVVHLDPEEEEAAILETPWMRVFPMPDDFWAIHRKAATRMSENLGELWGPPDYADRRIRVWDLERHRIRDEAPRSDG